MSFSMLISANESALLLNVPLEIGVPVTIGPNFMSFRTGDRPPPHPQVHYHRSRVIGSNRGLQSDTIHVQELLKTTETNSSGRLLLLARVGIIIHVRSIAKVEYNMQLRSQSSWESYVLEALDDDETRRPSAGRNHDCFNPTNCDDRVDWTSKRSRFVPLYLAYVAELSDRGRCSGRWTSCMQCGSSHSPKLLLLGPKLL
ncbi:hypothetical protein PM082_007714 [Marasmius tenuissimus]|nr:hypothetical protein PM082_007714 [Marasmius tenuissimus]